ncbi:beta-xylosidase [Flammeovirgaceae bacterium 311]|nr:beta-xylosidase [Flammeovirgaceae bacterium 311]
MNLPNSVKWWVWLLLLVQGCLACASSDPSPAPVTTDPDEDPLSYTNPVFTPVLADPSVVRAGEYFYAYGTEDNWGSEGGYRLVPVIRSADLVNWTFMNNAFRQKPDWKEQGGIWAPDVTPVGNSYYMYYSYSTWGDQNPGVGLAIAETPTGPFVDQGKVFLSDEIGVENSIDPFYIEEGGEKYLFWGSFHGIYAVALTEDGRGVSGDKVEIADTHLEGVYIYKKGDYYYLFASEGSCCDGANSTYRLRVGRSSSLLGPYVDKQGNDLKAGPYGEVILQTNREAYGFAGPGHNSEIITDDEGTDWILYHAIKKTNPYLDNGTNRRALMLDKLLWEEGWPTIHNEQPSLTQQEGPVFE